MKNYLTDLQNHLFEMMERMMDDELKDLSEEEFRRVAERHMMFNEHAKTAVANGALMAKCADSLYGLPVSEQLPLIPPSPAEKPVIVDGKRSRLLQIPASKK